MGWGVLHGVDWVGPHQRPPQLPESAPPQPVTCAPNIKNNQVHDVSTSRHGLKFSTLMALEYISEMAEFKSDRDNC